MYQEANQGLGRSMSATPVAVRETEVQTQMAQVGYEIKKLEETIGSLGARLAPVIRMNQPDGVNKAIPEAVLVPHAGQIREFVRKLETLNSQAAYLLGNIEL